MVDISDMLIGSFSKIWHIIPIVIGIILFKRFINKKDKKQRMQKNEENEKNGLTLELRALKKFESLGYKVTSNKKDNENSKGIDLICNKENKTLLVQCDNNSIAKSITEEDIKTFYDKAQKYIKTNDIKQNTVEFRYVIPYSDGLHKSAIKILTDDSYNCKYMVL